MRGTRVIQSWENDETRKVFDRERSRACPNNLQRIALRKLLMLDAATRIDDLLIPPSNRLEKLSGDRAGQWSIRINLQWRICFNWNAGDAENVEIGTITRVKR